MTRPRPEPGWPLKHPPASHVHTHPGGFPTRIDALTLKEARAVILHLCDELWDLRHRSGTD